MNRLAIYVLAAGLASPAMAASAYPEQELAPRILAEHNRERAAVGAPPLRWDPTLASSAASYGPQLARLGRLVHSPRAGRPGQRENLARDLSFRATPEAMVGLWIDEKRHFTPGLFPAVSRTGQWKDVAHYTQMIWKGTTHVGCAVHREGQWDYLICRYSPPGNADGKSVF